MRAIYPIPRKPNPEYVREQTLLIMDLVTRINLNNQFRVNGFFMTNDLDLAVYDNAVLLSEPLFRCKTTFEPDSRYHFSNESTPEQIIDVLNQILIAQDSGRMEVAA